MSLIVTEIELETQSLALSSVTKYLKDVLLHLPTDTCARHSISLIALPLGCEGETPRRWNHGRQYGRLASLGV